MATGTVAVWSEVEKVATCEGCGRELAVKPSGTAARCPRCVAARPWVKSAGAPRPCVTEGCGRAVSPGAPAAWKHCDDCRAARASASLPGDSERMNLFFHVAGIHHQRTARGLAVGDRLYLVRDPAAPSGGGTAVELRTASGDLLGFVPAKGVNLAGRFGPRTTCQELSAAMDKGAYTEVKVWGTRTAPTGGRAVTVVGHCDAWKVPHPVRLEQAKKLGRPLNRRVEPLPFTVGERIHRSDPERAPALPPQPKRVVWRLPTSSAALRPTLTADDPAAKLVTAVVGFVVVFATAVFCFSR